MKLFLLMLLVLVTTGCVSVTKIPQASGGSKADGIVALSYTYSSLEVFDVDDSRADEEASRRCQNWDYSGAERFAFVSDIQLSSYSRMTTITYQCIS